MLLFRMGYKAPNSKAAAGCQVSSILAELHTMGLLRLHQFDHWEWCPSVLWWSQLQKGTLLPLLPLPCQQLASDGFQLIYFSAKVLLIRICSSGLDCFNLILPWLINQNVCDLRVNLNHKYVNILVTPLWFWPKTNRKTKEGIIYLIYVSVLFLL